MSTLLGIDLGTSAVKLLLRRSDGTTQKAREPYNEISPAGWLKALELALSRIDARSADAVGLSSQVGTFIIDDTHVVGWNSPAGLDELNRLKDLFSKEVFLQHIGMAHPDMVSYPIPRLMYFVEKYPGFRNVCMPKELLIRELTGSYVSDIYSWRGLADLKSCRYSPFFIDMLKNSSMTAELPPLIRPTELAGYVTSEAAKRFSLREGTPVYAGCNDFFAALLGSGIRRSGDMFDITGTSEHLGAIADDILDEHCLISGGYFSGFVRYGVTASSGPSLDMGRRLHSAETLLTSEECRTAPIFLPYMNGERCPVCDPMARGVMFGMGTGCTEKQMAYAVMEGVAFNLKQIYEKLAMPRVPVIACGGAAQNAELNRLKADILRTGIHVIDEPDASALGAAYIAGIGCGEYSGYDVLPGSEIIAEYSPSGEFFHSSRYEIYKQLYPALKDQFLTFGRL